jgi:hypothetical protein
MKILKMYLKEINCDMNKESNQHIASGTYNPCKLPTRGKNMQNHTVRSEYGDKYCKISVNRT